MSEEGKMWKDSEELKESGRSNRNSAVIDEFLVDSGSESINCSVKTFDVDSKPR